MLLENLQDYTDRVKPLQDQNELFGKIQNEFEKKWENGTFPGWPVSFSGGLGGGVSTFPGPSSPKRKQPSSILRQEGDSGFPLGQVQFEIPGLAHLTALSLSPTEQSVEKKVPR